MSMRRTVIDSNFDSVFDPAVPGTPAKLTIRLKISLFPRDPAPGADLMPVQPVHLAADMSQVRRGSLPDGDRTLFPCRSWLTPEFNRFKIRFKKMVELSWNEQLVLIPPVADAGADGIGDADYRQFIGAPHLAAHAKCVLDIQFAPTGGISHARMEALFLDPPTGKSFRSYQYRVTNEELEFSTYRNPRWPSLTFMQVTAAHEVGHWLGEAVGTTQSGRFLEHVDKAHCARQPNHAHNNDCEYGDKASKRMAMMGAGNLLTEHESLPWVKRMQEHTATSGGWTVMHRIDFNNFKAPISDRQKRLSGVRGPAGRPRAAA